MIIHKGSRIFLGRALCWSVFIMNFEISTAAPVNQRQIAAPPKEFFTFMRNFGYLEKNPTNSEALYSEEAIIVAIKQVQKFGAIPQTGYLDTKTLQLISSPRCGVIDITPDETNTRKRRYVIGAIGWKKRTITYFIANWSSKVGEEKVVLGMAIAFEAWSKYSNLKFKRVYDPSADIIIAFGSGDHHDNYPFDGPGNILAHAFYPYEMNSFGGDIHFDDDENWRENTTHLHEGVDFLSVAVHELGHSLGLAHSFDYSSIMFPYYKGTQTNPQLGYDDILAMYKMYIQNTLIEDATNAGSTDSSFETDETVEPTTEYIQRSTTKRIRKVYSTTETPASTSMVPLVTYHGDFDTVDDFKRKSMPNMTTTIPQTRNKTEVLPNICKGNFNAVSVLRGELFIFKDAYVWRLTDKFRIKQGYPVKIRQIFPNLPEEVRRIDAIYERETDNAIIMFSGEQYWIYDGVSFIEDSPRPLSDYGIENTTKLDAAIVWAKNGKTYLFSGDQFWRYNETTRRLDLHYPMKMDRWHGVPVRLDAATTMPNGKTYFFKGNYYWLFNNKWVRPERGYPRRASNVWLGCALS